MDLTFIFGANSKHAGDSFKAAKEMARKIVLSQKISKSATLVGAVVYDSDARWAFRIGEALDTLSTNDKIKRVQRYRDGNNVEKALELVQMTLGNVDGTTRLGALKTVILFLDNTDGLSKRAKEIASQLKDAGSKFVVVSLGKEVDVKDVIEMPSDIGGFLPMDDPLVDVDDIVASIRKMLKSGTFYILKCMTGHFFLLYIF